MSSKNIILTKVKNALRNKLVKEEILPETEEILFSKIQATLIESKSELIKQFENELIKINAEFYLAETFEKALEEIRRVLNSDNEFEIATTNQNLCRKVKDQIEKSNPKFHFIVANVFSSQERKEKISNIKTSVVEADFAVSDIAQLVFYYDNSKTSYPHFLCDFVIAIVEVKNLLANQFKLFEIIDKEKAKNMVFVAGPSRTADIEKVLVLGAHGPRKLLVILIDD
ncbi:MAG: LUD domain-containing protein [Ignavibacteriae bacterium]|nr:LUD domain-containing protein [Ignavibacteriota bacterium]